MFMVNAKAEGSANISITVSCWHPDDIKDKVKSLVGQIWPVPVVGYQSSVVSYQSSQRPTDTIHENSAETIQTKKAPPIQEELLNNSRQRPTLPLRHRGSTIGAGGLNFRVRDGNGCLPSAMVTEKMKIEYCLTDYPFQTTAQGMVCGKTYDMVWIFMVKPLDRLVSVSSIRYRTYTSDLSTR
jgi:hypothetical protein